MSGARLVLDMVREEARLRALSAGYRLAGDGDLKVRALVAAQAVKAAIRAIEDFDAAHGEARERELEA